jgi:protein TonB
MACWSCSGGVRWPASGRAEPIWPWLAASAALHLSLVAPLLIAGARAAPAAPLWAQVELIMQPTPTVGAAPAAPADAAPAVPAPPAEHDRPADAAAPPSNPSGKPAEAGAYPTPPPAPASRPAPADTTASRIASAAAPAVRLGDVAETGTGLVSGEAVIPAGLDSAVHNRLPAYPAEAARRGEEGVVFLLVHIAPDGRASAIDVEQSSGYDRLDEAARAAVSGWQFRPAMRDGLPMASSMEVEVHFDIRWKPK